MPKIQKQYVTWEDFDRIQDGDWTPGEHEHQRVDITDFWDTPFWSNIPDKPSSFAPSVHGNEAHDPDFSAVGHTHTRANITDFWGAPFWSNIPDKPSTFPPSAHATSHEKGGSDLIDTLGDLTVDKLIIGSYYLDSNGLVANNKIFNSSKWDGQTIYLSGLAGNDVLIYDSVDMRWENRPQAPEASKLVCGSYYLNSLIANNKVPDSDKWDGYQFADYLDQAVKQASNVKHGAIHCGTLTPTYNTGRIEVSGSDGEFSLQDRQSSIWSNTDRWVIYHNVNVLRFFRAGTDKVTIDENGNLTPITLKFGSYYLNSLIANNKVPDSDKWDGYQFADYLDQAVKTTSSPTFANLILGSNPAQSGIIRIPNNKDFRARNAANTADIILLTLSGGDLCDIGYNTKTRIGYAHDVLMGIDGGNVGIGAAPDMGGLQRGIYIEQTYPSVVFCQPSQAANEKKWDFFVNAKTLFGRCVNDAYSGAANWIEVYRGTGYAIDKIIFPNGDMGLGKDPTCKLDVNGTIKAVQFYLNLGGLLDVNLGTLEEGETITYDQGTAKWIDTWGVEYDNPRLVYKLYTDFFGYSNTASPPWTGGAIGSGTMTGIPALADHPGILKFRCGADANSGYRFATENDAFLIHGREHSELVFQMKRNADVKLKFGFQDSFAAGDPTDGVWLQVLDGNLRGKTANNGAISTTATGYNLSLNTWYRIKLAVNDGASLVTYILYSETGTQLWSNTLSTNIPTGAGRTTGHMIIATHSGTNAFDLVWVDMMIGSRAGTLTR